MINTAYIARSFFFLFLIAVLLSGRPVAQFMNLTINIEPELSATVESSLDFGSIVTNSGTRAINLGDLNMGVFSIRAISTQSLFISLIAPDELTHSDPEITDTIPIDLQLAYTNNGTNRPSDAVSLTDNKGLIAIYEDYGDSRVMSADPWQLSYLYVYGSIYVGDIVNGTYLAEITLSVQYD